MTSEDRGRTLRAASTVVVLRDAASSPEILMVRRREQATFMGGAFVFPGGSVDPSDRDVCHAGLCDGLDHAARQLADLSRDAAVAHHVAALRELFEEAGVLLARDRSGAFVSTTDPHRCGRLERARHEVHGGLATMREVAERERVTLALDSLVEWAWWVTPPLDTRRFDTRFFVARMPPGQTSAHDESETVDSRWTTAAAALEADRRNEIVLPPPTWMTLHELTAFTTVDEVLTFAAAAPIVRREPVVLQENGERRLKMPAAPPAAGDVSFILVNGQWRPGGVGGM